MKMMLAKSRPANAALASAGPFKGRLSVLIDMLGLAKRVGPARCAGGQPGCTLEGMPEALSREPFPLETCSDGVIRVRGTRVTLDTIWAAFQDGATAEEIVQQYPSLSLADAYEAIGYCLRNGALLAAYLAKRSESSEEIRRSNESRWPPEGIRARLLEQRRQ